MTGSLAKIQTTQFILAIFCGLFVSSAVADDKDAIVYHPARPSDELIQIARQIQEPTTPSVPPNQLKSSRFFLRVTEKRFILAGGAINKSAVLGGKPFTFLTVPQAAFGKSLLEVFAAIGYADDELIAQRGKEMVAIVARYSDEIKPSPVLDGTLPAVGWKDFIYVPTWKNAFVLFGRLADEAEINRDPGFQPFELTFGDQQQKSFVLGFSRAGKKRIATTPFDVLKQRGGDDWKYRSLLAKKLGMNSHFLGTGKTENAVFPKRGGVLEFIGPNRRVVDLKEAAVIDLGALEIIRSVGGQPSSRD